MISKLLLWAFLIPGILLLAEALTPLSVASLQVNAWLTVVLAVCGVNYFGRTFHRWKNTTTLVTFVSLAAVFSLLRYGLVWGGDWKTQTIIYQNRHSANRVIEYQMQNPGPGSYNQRTVDKIRLLPGINWLREFNTNSDAVLKSAIDTTKWKKVDIEKNELGLKYP